MLNLLRETSGKNLQMMSHRVNERGNDHCVIIYDADNFEPNVVNSFGLGLRKNRKPPPEFEPTKPAIMAGFTNKNYPENPPLIIGSIHHPGGEHNEMNLIVDQINKTKDDLKAYSAESPEAFVLGDYNHEDSVFKEALSTCGCTMLGAPEGSMAGPDFDSTNMGIDGIVTTAEMGVHLSVVPMKTAPPVDLGINIDLKFESKKPRKSFE